MENVPQTQQLCVGSGLCHLGSGHQGFFADWQLYLQADLRLYCPNEDWAVRPVIRAFDMSETRLVVSKLGVASHRGLYLI